MVRQRRWQDVDLQDPQGQCLERRQSGHGGRLGKTFQYGADPAHAWDFTWFFQGVITGWDDAIAGKNPGWINIGVATGADEYELVIQTAVPRHTSRR